MKIADIRFAHPNIKYEVEVSHYTARASTAIEWVILEAIKRCSELHDYSESSAADIFETIFMISDPDLLVLPCMLSLLDMGAIEADDLSDDTKLSETLMKSLRLTEIGSEMQREGLLPGASVADDFTVSYDPIRGNLTYFSDTWNVKQEEPNGIPLIDKDKLNETGFPQTAVSDMLMAELHSKKKSDTHFPWLMPNTRIEQIDCANEAVSWKTVKKTLCAGYGLVCSIEGIDDRDIMLQALRSIANDEHTGYLPYIDISDPDNEIKEIIDINEIQNRISAPMKSGKCVIISNKYYSHDISRAKSGKGAPIRILVIEECNEFKISVKDGLFTVYYDSKLLPQNEVFGSDEIGVCVGKLKLKAFDIEQDFAVGYIPISCSADVLELVKQALFNRIEMDYRMPFALYALGMKEECLNALIKMIKNTETVAEKVKLIEKINVFGNELLKITLISTELAGDLLLNTESITERCVSIDEALNVLEEYNSILSQDELYRIVLKNVLENMPSVNTVAELYRVWRHIKKTGSAYITYVVRNNLYRRFYNEFVMSDLLNKFNNENFPEMIVEEYTPVEISLFDMNRAVVSIMEILSDVITGINEESIRAAVILRKANIKQLQSAVRDWLRGCDMLEETLELTTEYVELDSGFADTAKMMNIVIEAVSLFCDTSSVKYSDVVIADTCALMNEPELLAWCDNKKTLLIIPQIVLAELDKLKDDEDEDKAYQARRAIRIIGNYNAFDWLNTKEVSDVSLLNPDLDPTSGDSKILSVAIRYFAKSPTIITNDINFRNIAVAHGIEAMSTESYHDEMKQQEARAAASNNRNRERNRSRRGRKK